MKGGREGLDMGMQYYLRVGGGGGGREGGRKGRRLELFLAVSCATCMS